MSKSPNPLAELVAWLSTYAAFPARRLQPKAELLLCFAAVGAAEPGDETRANAMLPGKDGAQTAALRAHAMRRSHAHHRSDNSAKV